MEKFWGSVGSFIAVIILCIIAVYLFLETVKLAVIIILIAIAGIAVIIGLFFLLTIVSMKLSYQYRERTYVSHTRLKIQKIISQVESNPEIKPPVEGKVLQFAPKTLSSAIQIQLNTEAQSLADYLADLRDSAVSEWEVKQYESQLEDLKNDLGVIPHPFSKRVTNINPLGDKLYELCSVFAKSLIGLFTGKKKKVRVGKAVETEWEEV